MIETIIGLGKAGCNLALKFHFLNGPIDYKVLLLDTESYLVEGIQQFLLPQVENPEAYENTPIRFGNFFSSLKRNEEILFIVAGSGKVSASSLIILEQLKHCKINILFIKPDLNILPENSDPTLLSKLVFGVLQEYTRSGVFERIFLVENSTIESILGGIPIKRYHEVINDTIISAFNVLNVLGATKPIIAFSQKPPVGARISTLGFYNLKEDEEQLFFSLDLITDSEYYFAYTEKVLETDRELPQDIKRKMLTKKQDNVRVSYSIYDSEHEHPYAYCLHHTSIVQN